MATSYTLLANFKAGRCSTPLRFDFSGFGRLGISEKSTLIQGTVHAFRIPHVLTPSHFRDLFTRLVVLMLDRATTNSGYLIVINVLRTFYFRIVIIQKSSSIVSEYTQELTLAISTTSEQPSLLTSYKLKDETNFGLSPLSLVLASQVD
ncbi:hypothetical protein F2Q69_00052094 [Brassica cretica]|uniref:Uncharacterized protein n=1 Tax=Brassica cretica TaxID=69181 RepID=A0A8S9MZY0_BRACR|nr:hypothetical protein F2Q69_00052094 [Brassica cretica]